jgi:hypothetical protein
MSIDLRLNYLLRRYLFRDNVERFPDAEAQSIGLKKAKQFEIEARKLHLMFWYSLVNYSDSIFQKDLFIPQLVDKIRRVENDAKEAYSKILDKSDSKILREYSKFSEEVLNEMDKAQQYYARALEIEALEYDKELETDQNVDQEEYNFEVGQLQKPENEDQDIELHSHPIHVDEDELSGYGMNIDDEGNVKESNPKITRSVKDKNSAKYVLSDDDDDDYPPKKDEDNPKSDDSIQDGYGLNIDEEGNYQDNDHLTPDINEQKFEEVIELEEPKPNPKPKRNTLIPSIKNEEFEPKQSEPLKTGIKSKIRSSKRKSHFVEEHEFFESLQNEANQEKKNITIPKLKLGVNEEEEESKHSSYIKNLGQETFRSDLIIARDDDISLNSGISDDDVLDERNTIGADEKILERVLAEKINLFMKSKQSTLTFLVGCLPISFLTFSLSFLDSFYLCNHFSVCIY